MWARRRECGVTVPGSFYFFVFVFFLFEEKLLRLSSSKRFRI